MGEWIVGAVMNVVGSIGINLGTNLLKLGHNERERVAAHEAALSGEKTVVKKHISQFSAWRIGVLVFALGNFINFLSFGYAAQSLLAALGSVQFVSNVGFAYWVLGESVNHWVLMATVFIVIGNIFFVSFGNHQSLIYTHDELLEKYTNHIYLGYCAFLVVIVVSLHAVYRRGTELAARKEGDLSPHWRTVIPLSYAMVSGAIGTHSVLFAKSLSILLRLTMNGESQLDGWFTYAVLVLFLVTASFWMARLNDGLSMFDAILIVPMLQIVWTFFSIVTGFIYFQEYQVFDGFRATMFGVGVCSLFIGMFLLAPESPKGQGRDVMLLAASEESESSPLMMSIAEVPSSVSREDGKSLVQHVASDAMAVMSRAKAAYTRSLGLGQDGLPATSVFAMPMLPSSRMQWRNPTSPTHWLGEDDDLDSPVIGSRA